MASANVYSVETPPELEYIDNNQGKNKDIRCLNYVFRLKTAGKKSCNFLCTGKNCCASISLKSISVDDTNKPEEPFVVIGLNLKHKDSCIPRLDEDFVQKRFLQVVKEKVQVNPMVPIQQLYEHQRAEERTQTQTTLPDYSSVKDRFKRIRSKTRNPNPTSLSNVVVNDIKTKDGKFNFMIYDNHKKNRILVFVSYTGLKMLSESNKWHSDGTFHTKAKYFGQLYTIHAYFPSS